ncbi:MAG TPA: HAD-IIB family hydrolase [Kofleriaceae bacterium]|nr:HAD-IIB family hydrolase [Kofleriaceae bacterium]
MRHPTPAPFASPFWLDHVQHPRLTLVVDLDGTLIPFADTPDHAALDAAGIALIDALVAAGVDVAIVTGRSCASAEPVRAAASSAWWFAEHGSSRYEHGTWIGPDDRAREVDELDQLASSLRALPELADARLERKACGLAVHWRSVPSELRASVIAAADQACTDWLDAQPAYELVEGVELLEVRHRSATAAHAIAWLRARAPDAHVLAIGNDTTGEDMFLALRDDEIGIAVRNFRMRRSRARAWLSSPDAVREFLAWILDARTRDDTRPPPVEQTPATPARARLVVVSNRAPSQVADGRMRQVSGLVSALLPALQTHEGIWLGWSGREREGTNPVLIETELQPARASFDLTPQQRSQFYDGFCNRALWPLLHSFPSRVRYSDAEWQTYVEVNELYARAALDLVEADGTIWAHDYHLLLMGRALRALGYRGPQGLFLHVPFPAPDVLETLPWADELLLAMTQYDLLGFHTEQWADNFRNGLRALQARTPRSLAVPSIGVLPIGVDPLSFRAVDDTLDREILGLRAALGTRRMILGVDRLDYSKGIPHRLRAFDRLLEQYPEWRGQVSFVQVSVPSRIEVPEYAELRHEVETLVGRINGRYGEADWVPVRYLYRSYDHRVLAQLYRTADVALVTPLRDGMNLVAKEFVAAQDVESPGVLVLSRFAGAAAELTEAVLTNPYHPDGLAADIDRALRMPIEERLSRHGSLARTLLDSTPQRWAGMFMSRLREHRRSLA